METSADRIAALIEALAAFNDGPGPGITRFSYGEADRMARRFLRGIFDELGLAVTEDGVGNLRARMEGRRPGLPPLLVGSHIDSVRDGGRFDGVVGVAGAIEAVRVLRENGAIPERPLEIVVFAEEEGSNFGTTMVGSKVLAGIYGIEELAALKTQDGESCLSLLTRNGYLGGGPDEAVKKIRAAALRPGEAYAMLELHVEQGGVLERAGAPLGVVKAVCGMRTLKVTVRGLSNHAGATPMDLRRDPMPAAAALILAIRRIARERALPDTVATVGRIVCRPNMPNVIPETVEFTVDIRDVEQQGIDLVCAALEEEIEMLAETEPVRIEAGLIGESPCIRFSKEIADTFAAAAKAAGAYCLRMQSGAVHDSAMLAGLTKAGMLFVPSRDGRSHTPGEYTDITEIKTGCDALLHAVCALTR